jgi:DNA replication protein DnaC
MNAWPLDKWIGCAKAHRHPEPAGQAISEVFEAERPKLVPHAGGFDGFHAVPASVSKTCLARFDNNKSSAAASAVGRPVEVHAHADRGVIRRHLHADGAGTAPPAHRRLCPLRQPREDHPMERSQLFDLMSGLKLYGMKAAFDEIMATAVKRQREPQRIIGDPLNAEIGGKQARSIKYQLTIAKPRLAKDRDNFQFEGTPINETLVNDLASGEFIAQRRNAVPAGGTGSGKSHLAIAIARSRIRSGARGRFHNGVDFVNRRESETRNGRQGRIADHLARLDFIILDEPGYSPFAQSGGQLLSTASAGSASAPPSSSPRTLPSVNGRASPGTRR